MLSLNAVNQIVHNVREKSLGHVLVCGFIFFCSRKNEYVRNIFCFQVREPLQYVFPYGRNNFPIRRPRPSWDNALGLNRCGHHYTIVVCFIAYIPTHTPNGRTNHSRKKISQKVYLNNNDCRKEVYRTCFDADGFCSNPPNDPHGCRVPARECLHWKIHLE